MSETPKRTAPTSDPHGPRSYADGSASRPEDRASDPEPDFPPTGTFRSSWRPVLLWVVGTLLVAPMLMFGLLWLDGRQADAGWLAFVALFAIGSGAYFAVRYRFFGTRRVTVTSDYVEAVPFVGAPLRLERAEAFSIEIGGDLKLGSRGRRLTVRDEGFASEDWADLTFALMGWKSDAPLSALPGVLLPDPLPIPILTEMDVASEVGDAVYVAQHNSALFWGFPFFGLMAVVGLLASWEAYQNSTWLEDPMMSIGLPVIGLAFCGLFLWILPQLVRRAAFLQDGIVIERFVGKPVRLPYGAITDAFGERIRTARGRFVLGQRNTGSFHRLLEPRLQAAQLSGDMLDDHIEEVRLLVPSLIVLALCGFVLPLVLIFAFDFNESEATFSMIVALLVAGAAALVMQHVRSTRRRNRPYA